MMLIYRVCVNLTVQYNKGLRTHKSKHVCYHKQRHVLHSHSNLLPTVQNNPHIQHDRGRTAAAWKVVMVGWLLSDNKI